MEYTGAQRAAIGTLDEPLLIVACAGSGKTQVISERIVEILRKHDGLAVIYASTRKAVDHLTTVLERAKIRAAGSRCRSTTASTSATG